MTKENPGETQYLRIKYFDRKDKVERTLPTIDARSQEHLGDAYRTIIELTREGRISPDEARQLRDTLVKDYNFDSATYFYNDDAFLSERIDGLLDDLSDEEVA